MQSIIMKSLAPSGISSSASTTKSILFHPLQSRATSRCPPPNSVSGQTRPSSATLARQRQYLDIAWKSTLGAPPGASTILKAPQSECELSEGWRPRPEHLSKEELWTAIRAEAMSIASLEPTLASHVYSTILGQATLEKSMAFLLANKLANATLLGTELMRLFLDAYKDDPEVMEACGTDMQAVYDRDAACESFVQCMIFFKGFQAIQAQRIANWLWKRGRKALALALQSRISEVFQVDIHPGARIGKGVMMDHATGIVIGETATIGDNVSMLHHVTLGGSGTGQGLRHPTIGHGVLLGAGVSVLGPVTIGAGSKVGAGSVVVSDLPRHCVAVGVPAKIIKRNLCTEPCGTMDQTADFILDYVI